MFERDRCIWNKDRYAWNKDRYAWNEGSYVWNKIEIFKIEVDKLVRTVDIF